MPSAFPSACPASTLPTKKSDMPASESATQMASSGRKGSSSKNGESTSTYAGPVYCRKMALAAVVSLVAETKVTMQPAYDAAVAQRALRRSGRSTAR